MADDIELPGVGDTVATDEIGGINYQRVKVSHGADGSATDVSSASPLPVAVLGVDGTVDTNNSTATPLGIDAVFTGTSTDLLDVAHVTVFAFADEDSATDGLSIQWSTDGTNWDETDVFTIPATDAKSFTFGPPCRYMRVVYTNGGTEQTAFRLQVILRTATMKGSSHRINDSIIGEDDAELVKSVVSGENPAGDFVNFSATTSGNFKVSLEEVNGVLVPVVQADPDDTTRQAVMDSSHKVPVAIGVVHHEIHEGDHYYLEGFIDLDDTDEFYMKMVTPDTTKWSHFTFRIQSSGILTTYLYEAATGGMTGGSGVTPLNSNRNSANTSGLVFTSGVLANTGQTTIVHTMKHGSEGFRESFGGAASREDELVLKQNTVYCRKFLSGSDANTVSFFADWYEHTDG